MIALSIAFVARELILMKPGERRLSEAYPWIVAFSFSREDLRVVIHCG